MRSLTLSFTDEDGSPRSVAVDQDRFTVGRHSACDLVIPDSRLSREHLLIERRGTSYFAEDRGSSNGSELNRVPLDAPAELSDGDELDLGGFRVGVSISSLQAEPAQEQKYVPATPEVPPAEPVASGGKRIPTAVIVAVPLATLIFVMLAGITAYVLTSAGPARTANAPVDTDLDDVPITKKEKEEPPPRPRETTATEPTPTPASRTSTDPGPEAEIAGAAKVEVHSAQFLRRIAQNDSKAFLTADQAKRVEARIRQLSGNPALAANITAAKKDASRIAAIARARNMKPQILAVAAINKLGTSRGDVAATAESMAGVLDKLATQIGNELADDALLMIAAYSQGEAGDFMKMRNLLQQIATQYPDSSRAIRTIWFLEQNKQIAAADFDRALSFLAAGTIAQNPREFGVNAEPLSL